MDEPKPRSRGRARRGGRPRGQTETRTEASGSRTRPARDRQAPSWLRSGEFQVLASQSLPETDSLQPGRLREVSPPPELPHASFYEDSPKEVKLENVKLEPFSGKEIEASSPWPPSESFPEHSHHKGKLQDVKTEPSDLIEFEDVKLEYTSPPASPGCSDTQETEKPEEHHEEPEQAAAISISSASSSPSVAVLSPASDAIISISSESAPPSPKKRRGGGSDETSSKLDSSDGDSSSDDSFDETAVRVDPASVLPAALLRAVCAWLRPYDLARLGELSRDWRRLAADEALWRGVTLDLTHRDHKPLRRRGQDDWYFDEDEYYKELAVDERRVLLRAPCLRKLLLPAGAWEQAVHDKVEEALGTLDKLPRMPCISGVDCNTRYALPLLQRAGPHAHRLDVVHPFPEHLKVIAGLSQLRELLLHLIIDESDDCLSRDVYNEAPIPALPPRLRRLRLFAPTGQHLAMLAGMKTLRKLDIDHFDSIPNDLSLVLPPQLEELRVDYVRPHDLEAYRRLPKLRRLSLGSFFPDELWSSAVESQPPRRGHCGLRWLRTPLRDLRRLPAVEATVLSLIRAHAATLEDLVIVTESYKWTAGDSAFIAAQLGVCGLRALRRLEMRHHCMSGYERACNAMLSALRQALRPHGTVVVCADRLLGDRPLVDPWDSDSDNEADG